MPTAEIPRGIVLAVLLVNCAEAINICFLFPFMAFMLEDMGFTGHRLGYYCGALAASFCTGQFISSYAWGFLSDHYGRKPTLVIGTLGTAIGTAIFGFSRSFPQAVVGRVMSGILSGNLGILKTYLTEITDESNRTKAFAILQTSGSIGNIIGPLIGGLLSKPASKYPRIFKPNSIWHHFPYLFPCILCVVNSILASAMCFLFLKETRVWSKLDVQPDKSKNNLDSSSHPLVESPIHSEAEFSTLGPAKGKESKAYCIVGDDEDESESDMNVDMERSDETTETESHYSSSTNKEASEVTVTVTELDEKKTKIDESNEPAGESGGSTNSEPTDSQTRKVLSERVVLMTTGAYGLLAFSYIILDETLPLFMKLEIERGGFSFHSTDIGFVLSMSGAVMLVFNVLVLPRLGTMSKLRLYKMTNICAVPWTLAWPLVGSFNRHVIESGYWGPQCGATYVMLLIISSVKNSLGVMTFTAIIILINNSVPSAYLGKVNGLGQSFAALARAAGPALGGALWSMSLKHETIYLNFLVTSALLLLGQGIVSLLPERIDKIEKTTESAAIEMT